MSTPSTWRKKRRRLNRIQAQHLVLGGGLLGLATADHLLRRGAKSVVVVEPGSAPSRLGLDDLGLVLRTGLPEYEALESRALLLLEEWTSYLEVDPCYRRCGSILAPPPDTPLPDQETLGAAEVSARQPRLKMPEESSAAFFREDGFLDTTQLLSALHWQVRRRGGRVIFDCEVDHLQQEGDRFRFRGGTRSGDAEYVYFTGDPAFRPLLSACGLRYPVATDTWHRFQLELGTSEAGLIRLLVPVEVEPAVGLPLELEEEGAPSGPDRRHAIFLDSGAGEQFLLLEGDRATSESQPPVDWGVLESMREKLGGQLPALGEATVRRGLAENRLALDPAAPGVQSSEDGRIQAAGAFGPFTLLLSLATAETMAERSDPAEAL